MCLSAATVTSRATARTSPGGTRREGAGYFYNPTVLADVSGDARLLKEEIFGPSRP